MANQETFVTNAAESTLSSSLALGGTTVNVTSTAAFPAVPFYATIDPSIDAKREVVLATGKTATTLTVTRAQDNTTDVAHDSGAVIAVVPVAALWTDINDRVDASGAALTTHEGAADPHPGYLTAAEGNAAYVAQTDETAQVIGETVLTASAASITFSAIPATFRHLLLVVTARSDRASPNTSDSLLLRINGDAAANYDFQRLTASGTTVSAVEGAAQSSLLVGVISATDATADVFGKSRVTLPDYRGADVKTALWDTGLDIPGTVRLLQHGQGNWANTAAITSITLLAATGNLVAGTVATLYGMKGA